MVEPKVHDCQGNFSLAHGEWPLANSVSHHAAERGLLAVFEFLQYLALICGQGLQRAQQCANLALPCDLNTRTMPEMALIVKPGQIDLVGLFFGT